MEFVIKVADTVFKVITQYELTAKLVKDYFSTEEAETCIEITLDDVEKERKIEFDNNVNFRSKDNYLEYISLERKVTEYLLDKGVYLIHGVLLTKDKLGYLFIASSGVGKSTHAQNWIRAFGDRVEIVNGDKPFIKIEDGVAYAYGTPWCGKEFFQVNKKVPLHNIVGLARGKENKIAPVSLLEIYPLLYQQTYKSRNKTRLAMTLTFLDNLKKVVSFYKLACNTDKESAIVAYKGMNKAFNFEDVLDIKGKLEYLTKGHSMLPLLRQNFDLSILQKLNKGEDVKVNDVILFKRDNGQYILHRLIKKNKDGTFNFLGDNQYHIEKKVRRNQLLAVLTGIDKGKGVFLDLATSPKYHDYVVKLTKQRLRRRISLFIKDKKAAVDKRWNNFKKKWNAFKKKVNSIFNKKPKTVINKTASPKIVNKTLPNKAVKKTSNKTPIKSNKKK